MRFTSPGRGWWLLLCSSLAWAQGGPSAKPSPRTALSPSGAAKSRPTSLLLDSDDGLAILGAALEAHHKAEVGSDCSHLVHSIYEQAGFPYKYMRSADLYAGVEEFRRVMHPQPGDLIVWTGHAGIVVNPAQHSFYSALRSGFGVQSYDSSYWKGRGHPRFYRYIKHAPPPGLSASNHPASLKTTDLSHAGVTRTMPAKATATTLEPPRENSSESVDPPPVIPVIPMVVMLKSTRPRIEQVRAAVLEQVRETGENLQAVNVLRLDPVVVAVDRLEVQKLHLMGDKGWVEVRISEPLVIGSKTLRSNKPGGLQRWSLRRHSDDTWELAIPQDAVYIPREVAVRLLAHQLAGLTDATSVSSNDQKVQLARLLSVLLETH